MANAIADLMEFYEQAKKSGRIRNPEAWALYQTWKRYNTEVTKHDQIKTLPVLRECPGGRI
jgi:hypothetical protein